MKKVIAWLLVLALTAAISIGATLAYLTDTDEDVNVMTLGKVKIDQLEYERIDDETANEDAKVQEFHDNKPLYPAVTGNGFDYTPGDTYVDWAQIGKDGYTSEIWNPENINNEVDKMVFVKNKGDYDAYVRSVFAFEAGKYTTLDEFQQMVHLNLNQTDWTWEWMQTPVAIPNADGTGTTNYFVATATYNKILAPDTLTEISLAQIALDKTATNEDVEAFGETYQVLVKSQGIQADGFEDPVFALEEGFGEITATNIPWDSDAPTKGIDLKNALHYLDGDTTTSAISKKITSVTFGLNKNYAEIVGTYEGTLVDVEQDVPVFVYYVPNGSNYDVYALADDVIYAPKDSSNLFKEMQIMATLDTSNLDFGRAELMNSLLYNCFALETLDVTGWDVSNATTFDRLFYTCKELKTVEGLGTWDTGNVTTTFGAFYECRKLIDIDGVGNWDTGNVTTMAHTFRACISLETLDVSDWDVSKVTAFNSMFSGAGSNAFDMKVKELDVSQWNPVSATHLNHMFYGCAQLTELDLSDWNMPNLHSTSHMFADCSKLEVIDFSGWQTTDKWYSMDGMFNDCRKVKSLDVSSFTTSGVAEFAQIFDACWALEEIKGLENWDTSNGCVFDEMFLSCGSLKELNLSSFDTRNARNGFKMENNDTYNGFYVTFSGVNKLEKLILGENFVFAGNGTVKPERQPKFPNPAAKEGYIGKWQNVDTGAVYLASEIPEKTAATYVPYYEYVPSGATMQNAVHYLNADPNGTKITTKVSNITFGLSKNYETITGQYTGVLVDAEQNGPAYAYYVPNGANYDVYILSDDIIYAPTDCSNLCYGMSNLASFNTSNLDFSRTTSMSRMLRDCKNLVTLDVSKWNTGNVTNLYEVFRNCEKVPVLNVSEWDVGNVTTMQNAFAYTYQITELPVENWNVSNVENMAAMFYHCEKISALDLDNWDVSKVTAMSNMFSSCYNLEEVKFANWNTESLTICSQMLFKCEKMKELDASNWNVSSLNSTKDMFAWCAQLEVVDVSGWDTSNITIMQDMFTQCYELKTIYASNLWDMSGVTVSDAMFFKCYSLVGGNGTTIDGNPVDGTYARIDTEETPGYFTYKAAPNSN